MTLQSQRWQRSNLQPLQIGDLPVPLWRTLWPSTRGTATRDSDATAVDRWYDATAAPTDKIEIGLHQWDGQLQAHGKIKHLLSGLIQSTNRLEAPPPASGPHRGATAPTPDWHRADFLAQLTNQSRHLGRIGGDTSLECFSRKINPSDARKIESAIAQVPKAYRSRPWSNSSINCPWATLRRSEEKRAVILPRSSQKRRSNQGWGSQVTSTERARAAEQSPCRQRGRIQLIRQGLKHVDPRSGPLLQLRHRRINDHPAVDDIHRFHQCCRPQTNPVAGG